MKKRSCRSGRLVPGILATLLLSSGWGLAAPKEGGAGLKEPLMIAAERVAFSPEESAYQLMKEEIGKAVERVDVMVFLFEWQPIADLLIDAQKRGVEVSVLTDARSDIPMADANGVRLKESAPQYLRRNGVKVVLYHHAPDSIMHNKVVLIDEDRFLLGSYNFQHQAETKNFEAFVLMRSAPFQAILREEYNRIWQISERSGEALAEGHSGFQFRWKRTLFAASSAVNLLLLALYLKARKRAAV